MKQCAVHPLRLAILAALLPFGHQAMAEASDTAVQDNSQVVDEVMVIGQRVSYANSSTNDVMQQSRSSLSNVMDMVNDLPGVNIAQGDAFGGDDYTTVINMRGFSINRADQQLGITIDGVPNGGSAYDGGSKANRFLDGENTARVDVGQGSADISSASLDALGGTLNFVSDDPMTERNTRIDLTSGDYNARRTFIRHDTGIIGDHTRAYVSLSESYNNRWIGTGSNGFTERTHVEAKSVTDLAKARITARLSHDTTHEDNYDYISLEQFRENPRWDRLTTFWTGDPDQDEYFAEAWSTLRDNTLLYVKGEFFLNDNMTLTVTPYAHLQDGRGDWLPPYQVLARNSNGDRVAKGGSSERYWWVDGNGDPVLDNDGKGVRNPADTTGLTRVSSYRHTHYDKERYGVTTNLDWTIGNHTIRTGIWAEQQDRNQLRDWHNVINPKVSHEFAQTPYWTQFDYNMTTNTFKYYLQDNIQLGDLRLSVGVQQYLVEIELKDQYNSNNNLKINSDSELLPSAGLVYDLNDRIELFAGYSENFKALPDSLLQPGNGSAADLRKLEPETATNIDVGFRYYGDALNLSATYYQVTFNDRISRLAYANAPDGSPDYLSQIEDRFVNLGGIESNGVELSLDWRLSQNLTFTSSLSLNDSTYAENVNDAVFENGVEVQPAKNDYRKGDKIAMVPETTAYASLAYNDGAYRAGITTNYTGEYYGQANGGNRDTIPAAAIYNLYVGYETAMQNSLFKSFDIGFTMNNVTDRTYIPGGREGAYLVGAGRTSAITASLNF